MRTSKQIQIVNDTPGHYASLDKNRFFDMPSGDTKGENSHWSPEVFDVYRDNVNIKLYSLTSDEVLDTSMLKTGFAEFNNVDKLFSSYDPSPTFESKFSFNAKFTSASMGEKWILFGSPHRADFYNRKARWSTCVGLQTSIRIHSKADTVLVDKLHLIYTRFGDEKLYFSELISKNLKKINDGYNRGYFYISDKDADIVQREKLVTVGAILDMHTRGNGYVNLYDFKLLRSRQSKIKKSLLIVPAPHRIRDRNNQTSVPIV